MKLRRVFVTMFALKKRPLALCLRAETPSSYHPTRFLNVQSSACSGGGTALRLVLELPGLDTWVSLLCRSPLWCMDFSDLGAFCYLSPLWNQYSWYLPRYSHELLERVFWGTRQQVHLVGQSIHQDPSKGNKWYLGKLVNSFSLPPLRWSEYDVLLILLMCSHTLMHSATLCLLGHRYRSLVYFEMIEADLLLYHPGFQEMFPPCWVNCWDVVRRAEHS